MSINASRFYAIGLAFVAASAVVSCSSDDSSEPNNSGNTNAGGSAAGTGTSGSTQTAGVPGTSGSGTGGSGTSGSGTGGSGTAGSGTAGSGGSGAPTCAGMKPAAPLITEFADLLANATNAGQFTYTLGVPGGTFAYQPMALTVTDAAKALNVKGNVKAYDGFGVYFTNCTDASAYTGVSFSIKGNVGPLNTLSFRFQTHATYPVDTVNKKGGCAVPAGTTDPYPLCHAASYDIMVTPAGSTVEVKFSQPMGGVPVAGVDGKDILGLEWAFPWAGATDTAYDVDVTIDDIKFTGGSSGGTGGTGGAGGTAGTGGTAGGGAGGTGGAP